jgi:hypothetical protein
MHGSEDLFLSCLGLAYIFQGFTFLLSSELQEGIAVCCFSSWHVSSFMLKVLLACRL